MAEINSMNDGEDRDQLLSEGTAWVLEMELVNSPTFNNFMYLNLFNSSPFIKDVEYIVDRDSKVMLIWLKLNLLGRVLFKKKGISEYILGELKKILPSFTCRVVYDREIFEMGLKKAKEKAERNEEVQNEGFNKRPLATSSDGDRRLGKDYRRYKVRKPSSILSNNDQQTPDKSKVRDETKQYNSSGGDGTSDS